MISAHNAEPHRRSNRPPTSRSNVAWHSRILLAEDNDEMRSMLAGILRRDGYAVIEGKPRTSIW